MNPVLLIVDMQVDFFAHPRLLTRRASLAECINSLAAAMRAVGVPIVWVKQEFSPDLSDATLEVKRERTQVVIAGTHGASILPELDVGESDRVVVKKRYSAFFGTDLDSILEHAKRDTIIVAGVNTHACIRTTVIDAYQRDYEVILARECIDSLDREHHDISWRYMDGKLGRGMDNDGIARWVAGTA